MNVNSRIVLKSNHC